MSKVESFADKRKRIAAMVKKNSDVRAKQISEYQKTDEYKKEMQHYNKVAPGMKKIIEKCINGEVTYKELKKYIIDNDAKEIYADIVTDILNEYETNYHQDVEYDDPETDKKLWKISYCNDKLLQPFYKINAKISKLVNK